MVSHLPVKLHVRMLTHYFSFQFACREVKNKSLFEHCHLGQRSVETLIQAVVPGHLETHLGELAACAWLEESTDGHVMSSLWLGETAKVLVCCKWNCVLMTDYHISGHIPFLCHNVPQSCLNKSWKPSQWGCLGSRRGASGAWLKQHWVQLFSTKGQVRVCVCVCVCVYLHIWQRTWIIQTM